MDVRDGKRGLNAIHRLHHYIGHHVVKDCFTCEFEGTFTAVGHGGLEPAGVENHPKRVGDCDIVIDY